jgi:transcriptional regulator with XRE-family HTH domain
MIDNERFKKIIFWLISQGVIKNQEDLARRMGYNPSFLSQVVSGIKPLSKKLTEKLSNISDNININYLYGDEKMLNREYSDNLPHNPETDTSDERKDLIQIIKSQQRTIELLAEKVSR